jgi:hypothetical protein
MAHWWKNVSAVCIGIEVRQCHITIATIIPKVILDIAEPTEGQKAKARLIA